MCITTLFRSVVVDVQLVMSFIKNPILCVYKMVFSAPCLCGL